MNRAVGLTGIGTAFPGGPIEQSLLWEGFFERQCETSARARRLFAAAGVRRRHAAANPLIENLSAWSTGARMRRYLSEALPLGKEAVTAALAAADLTPEELGLFAVVSCTGYATPGVDIQIAAQLGMAPDVQRLVIGHMGCYAALPGLGAAADFVAARGRPALLLCLELTSLHVQPPPLTGDQVVAHALFGDAAAALVVAPTTRPHAALELVDLQACTLGASMDQMSWDVTDHGFRMTLAHTVPDALGRAVEPVVADLLAKHGLRIPDVDAWAVHPGGPRILDTVGKSLALPASALTCSREVLSEYGNCSSATLLLVLDELRAQGRPRPGSVAVALAFGPGLTLYAALLRGH